MTNEGFIFLSCPHCAGEVIIFEKEKNCCIFRHGILKSNYQQIGPHESKDNCDRYIKEDLIYGCGKPFKLICENQQEKKYKLEICDYI